MIIMQVLISTLQMLLRIQFANVQSSLSLTALLFPLLPLSPFLSPPCLLSLHTALFLLSLVVTVTLGHGFLTAQKVGMMARIIATAAIYQKVGQVA